MFGAYRRSVCTGVIFFQIHDAQHSAPGVTSVYDAVSSVTVVYMAVRALEEDFALPVSDKPIELVCQLVAVPRRIVQGKQVRLQRVGRSKRKCRAAQQGAN